MSFRNPILPGFYPDPSVCRVGEDFYLVNSSFEYFPGVPLWHSRDLVNWRQIAHVLDRRSQLELGACKCSDGIYAPTLRHHRGVFYMITTLVVGGEYRNFYVTATDPAGPWSDPVFYDQNGIDPSLFFDDDGKVYFQSNRGMTFKMARAIYQSEIDLATGRRLTEPRVIWAGSGGCYVEGPHLYKRNGWYYLLTAEGGTAYGHMVAIGRSRSPWGPFEGCPHNPILSNRHAYEELHGTGHGDLVEASDGTWWMVHLAFRKTVDDIHTLGRETCLAPVEWVDDWPVVNRTATNSLLVSVPTLPAAPVPALPVRDDFDAPRLSLKWIHLRNPAPADYSLSERPGWLRLRGNASTLDELAAPAFAGKRQRHFAFTAETRLEFSPTRDAEEAGVSLLMTNQHRYDFFVTLRGGRRVLVVRYVLELIRHVATEIELPPGDVDLRVSGTKLLCTFACRQGDAPFRDLASINTRYLGTEVTGGYNGVILGLYATGGGAPASAPADFDWFDYLPSDAV
ncbi:MAG: glycoside hydrolase family 43 protein [Burkholderiales bacterium]|nr:glycoside hydrolase family 43 protein [Opitutaceae bacterium]